MQGSPAASSTPDLTTALGAQLRELLLAGRCPTSSLAEAFLFEADRAQTYAEVILPALRVGGIVVSDRNLYGTIAYQAFGQGVELDLVDRMNTAATGGRRPDLTFVLDVSPEIAAERRGGRGAVDRFDDKDLAFQMRVREGYLFAAARDSGHAHVIDARCTADEIFVRVQRLVEALLYPGPPDET